MFLLELPQYPPQAYFIYIVSHNTLLLIALAFFQITAIQYLHFFYVPAENTKYIP